MYTITPPGGFPVARFRAITANAANAAVNVEWLCLCDGHLDDI
jgi:hypothetical protein